MSIFLLRNKKIYILKNGRGIYVKENGEGHREALWEGRNHARPGTKGGPMYLTR